MRLLNSKQIEQADVMLVCSFIGWNMWNYARFSSVFNQQIHSTLGYYRYKFDT